VHIFNNKGEGMFYTSKVIKVLYSNRDIEEFIGYSYSTGDNRLYMEKDKQTIVIPYFNIYKIEIKQ